MTTMQKEIFAGSNFWETRKGRKKLFRENFLRKNIADLVSNSTKIYMYNLFGAIYLKRCFLQKQND